MDKTLILRRIKEEKNFTTDTQLADFLGISKAVLSNWYKRDTLDYDLVLSKCELMDLNWIVRGKKQASINTPDVVVVDNNSIGFLLDRYEALAIENGELKKEVANLKKDKESKQNNKPEYDLLTKPQPSMVAAPKSPP